MGANTDANKLNTGHSAYFVSNIGNQDWYIDNKATHHVTKDPNSLEQSTTNWGKQSLMVGNGQFVVVKATSSGSIHSLN